MAIDLPAVLACPRHGRRLTGDEGVDGSGDEQLVCPEGDSFTVYRGVPVLLAPERDEGRFVVRDLTGPNDDLRTEPVTGAEVDPYVDAHIVGTCGHLYAPAQGRLGRYPIPSIPLPPAPAVGVSLLDVGCNWGRWSLAAARAGYDVVGVEPSIEAVFAASRVARQLGAANRYVVGDGRWLPFVDGAFDVTFTNGVLYHLPRDQACAAIREMARVTRPGGTLLVQLAGSYGARRLSGRRTRVRNPLYEIRTWRPGEAVRFVREAMGDARLEADGYFSLNPQSSDVDLMAPRHRLVVRASDALRWASGTVRPLRHLADSFYVRATRQ